MGEENTKEISQTSNGAASDQIRQQLSSMDIRLASTDIEVDVSNAIKLSFDQIPALGVALGSLPEAFRKITTTFDVPTLLQPTTKEGVLLNPAILNKTKSGLIGSYFDAENKLAQARFQIVDPGTIKSVATIPYDPTSLFIAAALSQINQKLDAIQDTVNEMFEYMKQKDKAELRGNIRVLEILSKHIATTGTTIPGEIPPIQKLKISNKNPKRPSSICVLRLKRNSLKKDR